MGSHSTHRVSDVRIRRAEGKTAAFPKRRNGLQVAVLPPMEDMEEVSPSNLSSTLF